MSQPVFNQRKATEIAAFFLTQAGGSMEYLKLLKLMYLAERESFARYGHSITYDLFYSMKNGPVMGKTYDLIKSRNDCGEFWWEYISIEGYRACLISSIPSDTLSEVEKAILVAISKNFASWNQWDLVAFTHGFSEFVDTGGSRKPISYDEIRCAVGFEE
jgi:uncharacterized phage-associated protein